MRSGQSAFVSSQKRHSGPLGTRLGGTGAVIFCMKSVTRAPKASSTLSAGISTWWPSFDSALQLFAHALPLDEVRLRKQVHVELHLRNVRRRFLSGLRVIHDRSAVGEARYQVCPAADR